MAALLHSSGLTQLGDEYPARWVILLCLGVAGLIVAIMVSRGVAVSARIFRHAIDGARGSGNRFTSLAVMDLPEPVGVRLNGIRSKMEWGQRRIDAGWSRTVARSRTANQMRCCRRSTAAVSEILTHLSGLDSTIPLLSRLAQHGS